MPSCRLEFAIVRRVAGRRLATAVAAVGLALSGAHTAYAMPIAEGFLPPLWALFWFIVAAPFLALGMRSVSRQVERSPETKLALGMAGAFAFVLSALKLPSVTGSSSHPTGVALGAILFGPLPMVVLGTIVLIFQAIVLAHGGLTTLGANVVSMAVAGPLVGYAVFRLVLLLAAGHVRWAVFLAAAAADLATYVVTALQLALAFPSPAGGIAESLVRFLGVFAITQIPLAISEGLLTVVVFNLLAQYQPELLVELRVMPGPRGARARSATTETTATTTSSAITAPATVSVGDSVGEAAR